MDVFIFITNRTYFWKIDNIFSQCVSIDKYLGTTDLSWCISDQWKSIDHTGYGF